MRVALKDTLLLALVALLAVSCSAALDATPATLAGSDSAFLASWLGLDAAGAGRLATEGAKAATARRELLQNAGNFGEAVLPGAYPPPPPGRNTVTFTAFLDRVRAISFDRPRYLGLINRQVQLSQVGRPKPRSPVITLLFVRDKQGGGIFVRTQVTLGEKVTAQSFYNRLTVDPGPRAPWLTNAYPVNSNLFSFATTAPCNDKLCKFCFTSPQRCDVCVASKGVRNTPSFATVYKNRQGKCAVCTNFNCNTCKPGGTGQCATCKNTYFLTPIATCCKDSLCLRCPGRAGTNCQACKASTQIRRYGRFITVSIYKNRQGKCGPCLALNCKTCHVDGLCQVCNPNYKKRDNPQSRPGYCIRGSGTDPWRPRPAAAPRG